MKDNMYSATMEFVTERVNYHGANEAQGLQEAAGEFQSAVDCLKETLTAEQMPLFLDCETFYGGVDGEQMRFYYEAGFSDAIRFILGWRDGWK